MFLVSSSKMLKTTETAVVPRRAVPTRRRIRKKEMRWRNFKVLPPTSKHAASEGDGTLRVRAPKGPEVAACPSSSEQKKSLSIFNNLKTAHFPKCDF